MTIEYKSEAAEVAAVLKEQEDAIGLLPQPFVTAAMAQNENLKMVLDLTEEWDKTQPEMAAPWLPVLQYAVKRFWNRIRRQQSCL